MRKLFQRVLATMGLILIGEGSVWAAIEGLELVASGFSSPTFVTHAPGIDNRLFVTEQGGNIKVVNTITGSVGNFLTVPDTDDELEGGLLGLAFHPQYSTPGTPGYRKFYVYVTANDAIPFASHVRQYNVSSNPDVANATPREIIRWDQPAPQHNAGWIGFSPIDNYLYVASGDGGETSATAQDRSTLFGKILRIDVDGDDFPSSSANYHVPASNPFVGAADPGNQWRDEIWAYGVRNPFRDSFDRLTGDLWIADVGSSVREEINFQPAGSPGGQNYGWDRFEGDVDSSPGTPIPNDYVPPVYDYMRTTPPGFEGHAVTGGYVYRGPDADLQGLYFFADFVVPNVWTIDTSDLANADSNVDNINSELGPLFSSVEFISSMGEDGAGNLYLVSYQGDVYRILTDTQLPGDYNGNGFVDSGDYDVWKATFGSTTQLAADGNGDRMVGAADYTIWRDNLGRSLGTGAAALAAAVPEPTLPAFVVQVLGLAVFIGLTRRLHGRR